MEAMNRVVSGNLALVRSRTAWVSGEFYEEKSEVCVLGDEKAYRSLAKILLSMGDCDEPISVSYRHTRWGMELLLIPAAAPTTRPKVKIWERIRFRGRKAGMELVIYANAKGFSRLARIVERLATRALDDPSEHNHVDDWYDRWVVKRSVSLNIRAPVSRWTRQHLRDYYEFTRRRGEHFLPDGIEHIDAQSFLQQVTITRESPFLSLDDSHRP